MNTDNVNKYLETLAVFDIGILKKKYQSSI